MLRRGHFLSKWMGQSIHVEISHQIRSLSELLIHRVISTFLQLRPFHRFFFGWKRWENTTYGEKFPLFLAINHGHAFFEVIILPCRHCSVCSTCLRSLRDERCPMCDLGKRKQASLLGLPLTGRWLRWFFVICKKRTSKKSTNPPKQNMDLWIQNGWISFHDLR